MNGCLLKLQTLPVVTSQLFHGFNYATTPHSGIAMFWVISSSHFDRLHLMSYHQMHEDHTRY